jgi:hypothetical protein
MSRIPISYLQAKRVDNGNGKVGGGKDTIGEEEKRLQEEEAHHIG